MLKKYLIVFLVSMVPLIELRGAIPYGVAFGLPLWSTYVVAIIGNMLPVPFIFFFARYRAASARSISSAEGRSSVPHRAIPPEHAAWRPSGRGNS